MKIFFDQSTTIILPPQKTDYLIGSDLIGNLHTINDIKNKQYTKFLILSDRVVFALFNNQVIQSLKKINRNVLVSTIIPGERAKNISNISSIIKPFFHKGFDRNSCLIALGGGVTTDLGGFIASILLRGIDCIYIPTTLLNQVDGAIGGKTGVDFWQTKSLMYKNMLGTIRQPNMVISDLDTLQTLPEREVKSGLGEMVKYWIGWGIPTVDQLSDIFNNLHNLTKRDVLVKVIVNCQKIKLGIIQKDPFDTLGLREKLNLGHTIGHAIEAAALGQLSHGESVAIGLVAAAKTSLLKGILTKENYEKIKKTILKLGLPTKAKKLDKQKIIAALKLDKKAGKFVLIENIGKLKTGIIVEEKLINKVLTEIIV